MNKNRMPQKEITGEPQRALEDKIHWKKKMQLIFRKPPRKRTELDKDVK